MLLCVYGHITVKQLLAIYFLLIVGLLALWLSSAFPNLNIQSKWVGSEPAMILFKKSVSENVTNLNKLDRDDIKQLIDKNGELQSLINKIGQADPDILDRFPEMAQLCKAVDQFEESIDLIYVRPYRRKDGTYVRGHHKRKGRRKN